MIQLLYSVDNSAGFILTFIIRLSFTLYSLSYIMIQLSYSVDNSAGFVLTLIIRLSFTLRWVYLDFHYKATIYTVLTQLYYYTGFI